MLPRDDLSSLLFWSNIIPPSAPFSQSPNPMQNSLSPCLRAFHSLPWHSLFPWMWEMATFPPPTAALLLLLQFSVYSCHSLCSPWAASGEANCEENPGRGKPSGSSNQGWGHAISKKRVERSHTFFSFFKQNDRLEGREVFPYKLWVIVTVWCINRLQHFIAE